jgi:predicted acetyltransferase
MHIELRDAKQSVADRDWLTNVYPLYLHDLSEFDIGYYHLTERGLWEPDHLPDWLSNELQHSLIILASGERAGFAFVGQAPFPHMTPGLDYHMAEFFILRKLRRTGIGRAAALAAFDRFPGTWEVIEMPRNTTAVRFWRRVIGEYTHGQFEDAPIPGSERQVFRATPRQHAR